MHPRHHQRAPTCGSGSVPKDGLFVLNKGDGTIRLLVP